jgi:hypothetical protein
LGRRRFGTPTAQTPQSVSVALMRNANSDAPPRGLEAVSHEIEGQERGKVAPSPSSIVRHESRASVADPKDGIRTCARPLCAKAVPLTKKGKARKGKRFCSMKCQQQADCSGLKLIHLAL